MTKFCQTKGDYIRAIKFLKNQDYIEKIKSQSYRYDIKSLSINSSVSDFAPSLNGEELVFSTARDKGSVTSKIHFWNNKPFTNLYSAKISENGDLQTASKLSKKLNK